MSDYDPILCPGTWPQPVGHTHTCSRTAGHPGQCECLCGSTADSEQQEVTAVAIGEDGTAYLDDDTEVPAGQWEASTR